MKCYLISFVPLGTMLIMHRLGYMYTDPVASAAIAIGEAAAILIFLRWIGGSPSMRATPGWTWPLWWACCSCLLPQGTP